MLRKYIEIASNPFQTLGAISNNYFLYIAVTRDIHIHTDIQKYFFCSKFSGGKVTKLKRMLKQAVTHSK